ncbi:MAG: hypothetical protein BGO63_03985 [Candidatus Accumulibacter sp. 66-26]|nr:MAG: hypothetical protein BGO63_03985 [Candidatus Accumulibacter sp. 66-26]
MRFTKIRTLWCKLLGHRPPRNEADYAIETPSRLARTMMRVSTGRQRKVKVSWTCPRCDQHAAAVWDAQKWRPSAASWVSGHSGQKFFKWQISDISLRTPLGVLRAHALGLVLKGVCRLGFPVLIVGGPRSGKTVLLERTCPGKVLNTRARFMANGYRQVPIELGPESKAVIAVDDGEMLLSGWARTAALTLRKRHVLYAFQRIENAFLAGIPELYPGRRLLLVSLGASAVLPQKTY